MSAAPTGSSARPPAAGSDASAEAANSLAGTPIAVTTEGTTVVIAVEHRLDRFAGDALLDAASAAVATGPSRLDIDLRKLESFTDEGARSLVSCRTLGSHLAEGLHYRTGRGPGRDALLAAYADAGDLPGGA
ncbi:MAG TPA: hypothetical protein VF152_06490 [Acidimicrobiia bacterium]